ncbi:MAG: tetratricopeptide repeat protein [Gammaproteobacteria bacterium]
MNLLARILSHGFAVVIVAFLIVGFMYRGELFPEWELPEFLGLNKSQEATGMPAPADVSPDATVSAPAVVSAAGRAPAAMPAATPAVTAVAQTAEPGQPDAISAPAHPQVPMGKMDPRIGGMPQAEERAAEPKAITRTPGTAVTTAGTPVGRVTTTAPAISAAPRAETGQVAEAAKSTVSPGVAAMPGTVGRSDASAGQSAVATRIPGPAGAVTIPATGPEVNAAGAESRPPVPPMPGASTVDATGPQASTGTRRAAKAASPYQLLAAARESFWLRDYEGAERQYRQLIGVEPENPDGYGELGNMYFSQGEWDAAASAYYEAGVRLITAGQLSQASELVDVIRGLDGARADDLDQLITAAEGVP